MEKWLKNVIKIIIGITILSILFYKVGFNSIVTEIKEVNPIYLIGIVLVYPVLWMINAFNIFILTVPLHKTITYFQLLPYAILSWSIGNYAPGPIGEASMMYFLKKHDFQYGESGAVFVMDKLIALVVNLMFAITGFIIILEKVLAIELIIISIIFFIGVLFLFYSTWVKDIVKKYILRRYAEKFKGFSTLLREYVKHHKKELFYNFFASWVKVPTISLILYLGFTAIDPISKPSFALIMVINCAIAIISLIPITISGLGIRETLAVFFYGAIGIPAINVTSAYFIFLVTRYSLSAILLFAFGLKGDNYNLKKIKEMSLKE